MIDTTTFYIGEATAAELRAHVATACGVPASTLLVVPAVGYQWMEPSAYAGLTVLQCHQYEYGDFKLEVEVLLGGARLGVDPSEAHHFFQGLAAFLGTTVMFSDLNGGLLLSEAGAKARSITAQMPEEYDAVGPLVRPGSPSSTKGGPPAD